MTNEEILAIVSPFVSRFGNGKEDFIPLPRVLCSRCRTPEESEDMTIEDACRMLRERSMELAETTANYLRLLEKTVAENHRSMKEVAPIYFAHQT